jgi:hypothetical protein
MFLGLLVSEVNMMDWTKASIEEEIYNISRRISKEGTTWEIMRRQEGNNKTEFTQQVSKEIVQDRV